MGTEVKVIGLGDDKGNTFADVEVGDVFQCSDHILWRRIDEPEGSEENCIELENFGTYQMDDEEAVTIFDAEITVKLTRRA